MPVALGIAADHQGFKIALNVIEHKGMSQSQFRRQRNASTEPLERLEQK